MLQVNELILNGFRNHENTTVPLNAVNLFIGRNGEGKSSIRMALEYLLTGRVLGVTDEGGKGFDDLIDDEGTGAMGVWGDVEGLGTISRAPGTGLSVPGLTGPSSAQEAVLYDRIGCNRDVITACLNTSRFLDFPANDQKNMLFRLMGLEFDKSKLQGHVPDTCREEFNRLYPGALAGGAEVFDSLHKTFSDARKLAKKKRDDLKADVKAVPTIDLPPGAWEARDQVGEQLAALKDERDGLQVQLGRLEAEEDAREIAAEEARVAAIDAEEKRLRGAAAAEDARARKAAEAEANAPEIERLEMLINALEHKEAELRPPTTDEAAAKKFEAELQVAIEEDEAALDAARQKHTDTLMEVSRAAAEKDAAAKLAKTLETSATCPLGPGVVCGADRKKMAAAVRAQVEEAERGGATARLSVEAATKEVTAARAQVDASRKVLQDHRVRMNDWGRACLDIDKARADLAALQPAEGDDGDD